MTATEKWNDPWFSTLPIQHKLFWIYLLDNCNHAGIWEANIPLLKFHLGDNYEMEKDLFENKVFEYSPGKYFIQNFIDFQYGELKEDNRAHLSVINILKKEGLYKTLISPLQGDKDKDKDKDIDKDKDKDKDNAEIIFIYDLYPSTDKNNNKRSTGKCSKDKDKISKLIKSIGFEQLKLRIENYLKNCDRTKEWLKNFSVLLNNLPEIVEEIKQEENKKAERQWYKA